MNKNIRRIISMTLLLGAVSTIVPNNFIFNNGEAYAATYDNAANGNLQELNFYKENGLKLSILKDGFYGKELSSLADTDEYYVVLDNSDYISIQAEIAGDGSNVVKAFTTNDKDESGYDIKSGKDNDIRIGSGTQTIYLRTYRSESDYKYALKKGRVDDCIKTYTIHVRKSNKVSESESLKSTVYLKDLYLSDCDISFSRKTTNYYLNVDEDVKEILLRATPNDSDATVEVNDDELSEDDDYEKTIDLEKGDNVYKIVVENDDDILTYTLNIYRGNDKKYEDSSDNDSSSNNSKWELGEYNTSATNTWKKQNGKWQYIDGTGQALKNKWWFDVKDGNSYYLDQEGYASTGWKNINNKWYYFDGNGAMKTGWIQSGANWYYLNKGGIMQTGWTEDLNNKWYYLGDDGAMKTGWLQDTDGNWYY
ncbi:MAG: cadherin-like beta sandwich domain-containing protein, partial [Clostridium sp.]|nr:cadherin-like beta sandwich domain-containing protein [Clostridium sp.]